MKIGFEAVNILGPSGIENYTRNLISSIAMLDSKTHVNLYTTRKRKKYLEDYFQGIPNLNYRNFFLHPLVFGEGGSSFYNFIRKNFLIRKACNEVDLFHISNPCNYSKSARNIVTTVHDTFIFDKLEKDIKIDKESKVFIQNFKDAIKFSPVIFTPTLTVKKDLLSKFINIDPDNIIVTYEGVNRNFQKLEPDYNILSKYGITADTRFFLFVSRFDVRKNYYGIAEAFANISSKTRKDVKFVFVGSAKSLITRKFYEFIHKIGIEDSFIHLDNISEKHLIHLYNSALALVFATFAEGFGLPVIEAMKCGCPVITSDTSCMPEVASDAALLVNSYEIENISNAMTSLLENDGLRQRYIEKGLKRAEFFTWEKTAELTYLGYQKALKLIG